MKPLAETNAAKEASLTTFLDPLNAVAFATLTEKGELLHANRGFLRILNATSADGQTEDIRSFFVHPSFSELLSIDSAADGPAYHGIINVGNNLTFCRSLKGVVYHRDHQLLLIAEYDVVEMEALNAQVIELNEELATAQRELVRSNRKLQASEARLREMSLTDPLTGLANRRHLMECIGNAIERFKRYKEPFSAIMTDIDFFKKVNDTFGHDVGDEVLIGFAKLLKSSIRSGDLVARQGGEEFILVLPNASLSQAIGKAEELRIATEQMFFESMQRGITGSFGVAEYQPGDTMDDLLKQVDEGVYRSKEGGRNRVSACTATDPVT